MTSASNPGAAPPIQEVPGASPLAAGVGTLGFLAATTVGALALASSSPAGAVGLERFESCEAIDEWVGDVAASQGEWWRDGASPRLFPWSIDLDGDDDAMASDVAAPEASDGGTQAGGRDVDTGSGTTGGTNTVVAGVDEVDVIDRIGDDRLLVTSSGTLSLVDLASRQRVASLGGLPLDARISHDGGIVFAAGSGVSGSGVVVQRIRVDGDALALDGTWTTDGYLVDARRSGGRLHVVAGYHAAGAVPFPDRPVPCDQVWRPVAPSTSTAATLVASFAETGDLGPVTSAEIVGAAGTVLVTSGAVYVATESRVGGETSTGLHRLSLGSLEPTGSGAVPGVVAGPFALDEHDGHLRVATHLPSGGAVPCDVCGGVPEGDVIVGVDAPGGATEPVAPVAPVARQVPEPPPEEPPTTDPEVTTTTEPGSTTTTEPETTTTTEPEASTTTTTEPEATTTSTTASTTTTTAPAPPDALAEVFVLDLDGALDIVGRTGRFGHDFETIHGVRFLGDVAYVVTFRQTDPFWVVDLADPTAPRVVGELQIPGFSAYLHPAGEGRVVGFGPDGTGALAARLFDVSDPTAPTVLDEVPFGHASAIVWDHHAFAFLGGTRFAVPATDYDARTETGAVVFDVAGGRLQVVERAMVERIDLEAERVLRGPDGTWWLYGYGRLLTTDGIEVVVGP